MATKAGRTAHIRRKYSRAQLFFYFAQFCTLVCVLYFWFSPQLPGYSIAAIAVVTALMSFQRHMNMRQQAIWILLIGAFFVLELSAIRTDRNDYNQDHRPKPAETKTYAEYRVGDDQGPGWKPARGQRKYLFGNEPGFAAAQLDDSLRRSKRILDAGNSTEDSQRKPGNDDESVRLTIANPKFSPAVC